ncbi:transposase family protein [Paraburkholderia sp. BL10I2N1]|uniref:transposase family protein n=1 Tax=Paraburkholderia sp. BL10I2N1 TaxID=1938796 RepID=UPI001FB5A82C|nr:transposase family protein [Paraburkholderia sp. BL10I2N1]
MDQGIPSHDTFGRVFAALNPKQFEACFIRWMSRLFPALASAQSEAVRGLLHSLDESPVPGFSQSGRGDPPRGLPSGRALLLKGAIVTPGPSSWLVNCRLCSLAFPS